MGDDGDGDAGIGTAMLGLALPGNGLQADTLAWSAGLGALDFGALKRWNGRKKSLQFELPWTSTQLFGTCFLFLGLDRDWIGFGDLGSRVIGRVFE